VPQTVARSRESTQKVATSRESTLNLRIDADLKAEFVAVAEAEDRPVSEVLRSLMRDYVEQARTRRFAAEARRQSRMITDSEDEAEVMRWIQDVSAIEGDR
jgi:antitoxin component of RelBE/YafQ-DinJ toxin-antitoxin module